MSNTIPESLRLALLSYAERIMAERPPDFVLQGYMDRWFFAERGQKCNIYLHRFRGNDSDRALHDHPFNSVSTILKGSYIEHFHEVPLAVGANGKYITYGIARKEGHVIERPAETMHRISLIAPGQEVISLFAVGERIRDWGFLDPVLGWVQWQEYERAYDTIPNQWAIDTYQLIEGELVKTIEEETRVEHFITKAQTEIRQGARGPHKGKFKL